mmetsp:Transcript_38493/g.71100  ORF Transcript_38493/g.71100 Transcript_38493/m.71100 type:complete len:222 (-) Transcript_38493:25-690(-)
MIHFPHQPPYVDRRILRYVPPDLLPHRSLHVVQQLPQLVADLGALGRERPEGVLAAQQVGRHVVGGNVPRDDGEEDRRDDVGHVAAAGGGVDAVGIRPEGQDEALEGVGALHGVGDLGHSLAPSHQKPGQIPGHESSVDLRQPPHARRRVLRQSRNRLNISVRVHGVAHQQRYQVLDHVGGVRLQRPGIGPAPDADLPHGPHRVVAHGRVHRIHARDRLGQ